MNRLAVKRSITIPPKVDQFVTMLVETGEHKNRSEAIASLLDAQMKLIQKRNVKNEAR